VTAGGTERALFVNVTVVATCGLVYELVAGTLASYTLGDSITQFSLVIGLYLSAMGVGAWLSGQIEEPLARRFLEVELGVALTGGLSAPLLFLAFSRVTWFPVLLYGTVVSIGVLVGLELPLLMRILKDQLDFKALVSRVLSLDYLGALLASLVFPIFCVPRLGLVRTSLLFGLGNAGVALWGSWLFRGILGRAATAALRREALVVILLLAAALLQADRLTRWGEDAMFADDVVYAETTPHQRIVISRGKGGFQLFLNAHLQFSSADEYRYHEALVHPAMVLAGAPRRVLILGGGDGLAAREVLRHPEVEAVTLVDLDPRMTTLYRRFPPLAALSGDALGDRRVEIVNQDALVWLAEGPAAASGYDVAIVDFPDPSTFAVGKLYTTRFYRLLARRLSAEGTVAVQSASPLLARRSFWCVVETLRAAGFTVAPYQAAVPSFGVWGFSLARRTPFAPPATAPRGLRYLNDATLAALFALPADIGPLPVEVNRLDHQVLVHYYERESRRWQ
jgi:spermidine synthase